MLRRTLLATASALVIGFAVHPAPAAADIVIATAGPMTGTNASFGEQMRKGAEMAVADINAKGGVLGQKLALEVGDDACDPKQAVSVANQLAGKGVKFVAGHYCSSSSIPASKVYLEEGILQITPASTNPRFTDEGSWNTFRTVGRDDQQGVVAGTWLAKEFKGKRVAILHDNTTYGKGLADETKKNMNKAGMQEAVYAAYVPGEKDYSSLVSRLKSEKIDVIYIGGYHTEAGLIARQSREQGMKAAVVSGDALVTTQFWEIAGPAGDGTVFTFPSDPRMRPTAKDVVAEFKKVGYDPEGYTLYTYATIQVWAEAAEKAKSLDPKTIADTLKSSGPWPSVLGDYSFDKKGDITKLDYVFYIWHDGNYHEM
jgi:branched-chain amino acid transport system substrate-binding protein